MLCDGLNWRRTTWLTSFGIAWLRKMWQLVPLYQLPSSEHAYAHYAKRNQGDKQAARAAEEKCPRFALSELLSVVALASIA